MADNKIGVLFILFITIIIGAVLVNSLADSVWENVNVYTQSNDTIDISSARNTVTGNMTPNSELAMAENYIVDVTSATLYNVNGSEYTLTEGTDFTVETTDGDLTFFDTLTLSNDSDSELGNITEFVYTHGDSYVKSSVGRTLLDNFLVLFFIIGLVVWAIYLVKKEFLDELGM